MSVWAIFCNLIPTVTSKAFIDDAYMWANINHRADLKRALEVTYFWDTLTGQLSNPKKCQLWVSDPTKKKMVIALFPDIPLADVIDVLGIKMYVSSLRSYDFDPKKGVKVVDDLRNIAALPLKPDIKQHLIGTKVIPQLTYGSAITKIPQKVLWKTQNEVVNVIWARRPHWRARLLVLGVVAKPHRVEPLIARAYAAILDFVRFLHQMPSAIQTCCDLQGAATWPRDSLIQQIADAVGHLGLTLHSGLRISFRGSCPISLYELHHCDFTKPLQYFARQKCYTDAAKSTRKDLRSCQDIFDPDLSSLFLRSSGLHLDSTIPNRIFFESVQVGCNLTNDRLYRAELVAAPNCRLYDCAKETWEHLVYHCPGVESAISRPPDHEFGVNFPMFGLCTHPRKVALSRLRLSAVGDTSGSFDPERLELLWTDGSVQWGSYFWLATGAYAIVNAQFQVVESGGVNHWELSAYTTELFALLRAVKRASCRIHVRSDCQSIVDQFNDLCRTLQVNPGWSHQAWWHELRCTLTLRLLVCTTPIIVSWTPSHLLEHLPPALITEAAARECGSSSRDIIANRVADHEAKRIATDLSPIRPSDQKIVECAILRRHEWLVMLNWLLETTQPSPTFTQAAPTTTDTAASVISRFPQWLWGTPLTEFSWKPKIFTRQSQPSRWSFTEEDWRDFRLFLQGLHWKVDSEACVATTELAAGISFYHHLILVFRSMLKQALRLENAQILPGDLVATTKKYSGCAFPKGIIAGAAVHMTDCERLKLVHLFDNGAGRALSTWDVVLPVPDN